MKRPDDWRQEIDRLDKQVVAILNRRARCVLGLAPLKRRRGLPVVDPDRERAVLDNVRDANLGPLPERSVRRIFTAVIEEMRAMQQDLDD